MAEYYTLDVEPRELTKKRSAKALRREGKIPAVYYYHGMENVNLALDQNTLYDALHSGHRVFELHLGDTPHYVMIKELQYHPVTDEIIHVDIMRVRRKEKMTISVPIVLEGHAEGVKEGGVMMQNLSTLEISCYPTDVPDHISIDISELMINESLDVRDITPPENIDILADEDTTVVSITVPQEEIEEAPAVEEELTEEELAELEEGAEEAEEGEEAEGDGETEEGEASDES